MFVQAILELIQRGRADDLRWKMVSIVHNSDPEGVSPDARDYSRLDQPPGVSSGVARERVRCQRRSPSPGPEHHGVAGTPQSCPIVGGGGITKVTSGLRVLLGTAGVAVRGPT